MFYPKNLQKQHHAYVQGTDKDDTEGYGIYTIGKSLKKPMVKGVIEKIDDTRDARNRMKRPL